ncbi:uncharacterized protein [Montipora foliosa]|uniref:uncharacterized protein isoform X3 n=1 Tax=Montipora foliosa TaxID=591990 RepID=UPI0035F12D51
MRATILFSLLSLLLGLIECIQHDCGKNQFPIFWPNGSFKRCLDCAKCQPGSGLYPKKCGEKITHPPNNIHCKLCEGGKTFSEKYDSSGCKSCHLCAQHEIVTQDCTPRSDTVCSGTCVQGYFYHNSTRDCQKCSYCCNDGKDEKQQECIDQGLGVSHLQNCNPRPDKTCGPAPTTTSDQQHINDQQHIKIALILSCVGIIVLLGAGFIYCVIRIWLRRIRQRNERCNPGNRALHVVCVPATNDGSQANNSTTEKLLDLAQEDSALSSISESRDGHPGKKGAEGGHEMKRPRSGYQGLPEEDPDQPQAVAANNSTTENLRDSAQEDRALSSTSEIRDGQPGKKANNSTTENLRDSAQEDRALSSTSEIRDGQPGKKGAESGHERKRPRSGSKHEAVSRKLSKDPAYQTLPDEDSDEPQGAKGGNERRRSRSGSALLCRKSSISPQDPEPNNQSSPSQDTDQPLGNSYLPFTIEEDPKTQTKPEGSRVELKCRVKGEKEVIYKWFKDEEELPEEKSPCLIRDPLKVKDFGSYRCEVGSCDADRNSSHVAELDVAPSDGRRYSLLAEVFKENFNIREKVEKLLCKEISGCPAWKQVASSYNHEDLSSFARCKNPGEEVIEFLLSSNPNLSVYNFCKKLKEKRIRRLDIVTALEDFLVQNDGRPNNVGKI